MAEMTPADIDSFLQAPRHAIVGTNRADGPPQMSPVWYLYDNGRLFITVFSNSAKLHNLARDPRISVCVDGCYPDARSIIITGTADMIMHGHPLEKEMTWRIIRHYHQSEEEARRYADSIRGQETVLIVVDPQRIISQEFN